MVSCQLCVSGQFSNPLFSQGHTPQPHMCIPNLSRDFHGDISQIPRTHHVGTSPYQSMHYGSPIAGAQTWLNNNKPLLLNTIPHSTSTLFPKYLSGHLPVVRSLPLHFPGSPIVPCLDDSNSLLSPLPNYLLCSL